jgi:hypothetical protein
MMRASQKLNNSLVRRTRITSGMQMAPLNSLAHQKHHLIRNFNFLCKMNESSDDIAAKGSVLFV